MIWELRDAFPPMCGKLALFDRGGLGAIHRLALYTILGSRFHKVLWTLFAAPERPGLPAASVCIVWGPGGRWGSLHLVDWGFLGAEAQPCNAPGFHAQPDSAGRDIQLLCSG